MPALREAADRYLAIRRGLGYQLKVEGRMLGQFVDFCYARGLKCATVVAVLAGATAPAGALIPYRPIRQCWLSAGRGQAFWTAALDARWRRSSGRLRLCSTRS